MRAVPGCARHSAVRDELTRGAFDGRDFRLMFDGQKGLHRDFRHWPELHPSNHMTVLSKAHFSFIHDPANNPPVFRSRVRSNFPAPSATASTLAGIPTKCSH